jgi:opacity protein-like surface antigen
MKNVLHIISAAVLLAVLVVPLNAQTANPINFGARAGLNLGQASLTPDVTSPLSKSFRTGFNGGLYADFGVAEGVFVDVEALYQQGGVKITGNPGGDITVKYDDINVPVSLKYKFAMQGSSVKPYIFAGGNVGFSTKAEVEAGTLTLDIKDSTESVNYGVHFGAGVEFEVSPGVNILLDGRYGIGLKDVDKTAGEAKPWNIAIMAGVSVKIN